MSESNAPIGIFDSGVGGLTVVRAVRRLMPTESIVYLGDTARVPYGTKSPDIVRQYALNCGSFLVHCGAKAIVVACNTASAVSVPMLRQKLNIPVVGVIGPGAAAAVQASPKGVIGIIGTQSTLASGSYQTAIRALLPAAKIHTATCPLFVPMAEEAMQEHPATKIMVAEYLAPLLKANIDTLVLGCTHYPLLIDSIAEVAGPNVRIINSANPVAAFIQDKLREQQLSNTSGQPGSARYYSTDVPERFKAVGQQFLGGDLNDVEAIDLATIAHSNQ